MSQQRSTFARTHTNEKYTCTSTYIYRNVYLHRWRATGKQPALSDSRLLLFATTPSVGPAKEEAKVMALMMMAEAQEEEEQGLAARQTEVAAVKCVR